MKRMHFMSKSSHVCMKKEEINKNNQIRQGRDKKREKKKRSSLIVVRYINMNLEKKFWDSMTDCTLICNSIRNGSFSESQMRQKKGSRENKILIHSIEH